MQVFNVVDPTNISHVRNFKLATSSAPYVYAGGGSEQAVGKSIAYADKYVYLGLSTTVNGPGFHIIDVSDPLNPVHVSSWPTPAPSFGPSGAPINAIWVRDNYAYIAHPEGLVGAENEELTVLDISNPANPVRVSGFDGADNGIGANGKSLYVVGSTIYFGRTASKISGNSSDAFPELFILDATDPENLPSIPKGSKSLDPLPTGPGEESLNGLIVRDYLAFLIENSKLQILQIDNPSNITSYALDLTLEPGTGGGQQGSASDCEGNYLFIGSESSDDKGYLSVISGS